MGSAMRISGGIATVAVMMAGATVAQPAYARQTVHVPCSVSALVTAVAAANAAGSGTLVLAPNCNYALTTPAASGRGPDGLLISGDLTIIGSGGTHISRPGSAVPFRIIEVTAGAELHGRNVFVSGGLTNNAVPTNDTGGGILNSRGNVTLDHVTLTGNTADNGAGLSNDSGQVHLLDTLVENNTTRVGGGGGGGVYNDGRVTTDNSIIRLNHANTNGGGVYNGQGGRFEAFRTTVERNTTGVNGAAFFNAADGNLVLERTLVQLNVAANGGGVHDAGLSSRVELIHSVIRSNTPNNCTPLGAVFGCTG
jgi:hypothetical protein